MTVRELRSIINSLSANGVISADKEVEIGTDDSLSSYDLDTATIESVTVYKDRIRLELTRGEDNGR